MNKKALTLIELVVTIAILGIITIVAIPSVKNIQELNIDKKFVAFEKSIAAASKLYVDNYQEDIFGSRGTGCEIIYYEDLKAKDLIEDIQVKDTNCNNYGAPAEHDYTFIIARRTKNMNVNYETYMSCRDSNNKIVYGKGAIKTSDIPCALEDGKGPVLKIVDYGPNAGKDYTIDKKPQLKVEITDEGVGLKENQEVKYQWYQDSEELDEEGTINFGNENWDPKASATIPLPSEMNDIGESTEFQVIVYGEIEDMEGNTTESDLIPPVKSQEVEETDIDEEDTTTDTIEEDDTVTEDNIGLESWSYTINYYVGTVSIQFNLNGGTLMDPHHANITTNSAGYVLLNGSPVVQKIKYGQQINPPDGLLNYDNPKWLNIDKSGYISISSRNPICM